MYKEVTTRLLILALIIISVAAFSFNSSFTGKSIINAPDLSIAELGINLGEKENYNNQFLSNKITAVVCNNHNSPIDRYKIRFVMNNRVYDGEKSNLEPKECTKVHTSFKPFMENIRYVEAYIVADPLNSIIEANENNNRFYKVLNLSLYSPNLKITDLKLIDYGSFEEDKLLVRICNTNKKIPIKRRFDVVISLGGVQRQFPYSGNINPNSCAVTYSSSLSYFGLTKKKEVNVKAVVDYANNVVESDEGDNFIYRTFTFR